MRLLLCPLDHIGPNCLLLQSCCMPVAAPKIHQRSLVLYESSHGQTSTDHGRLGRRVIECPRCVRQNAAPVESLLLMSNRYSAMCSERGVYAIRDEADALGSGRSPASMPEQVFPCCCLVRKQLWTASLAYSVLMNSSYDQCLLTRESIIIFRWLTTSWMKDMAYSGDCFTSNGLHWWHALQAQYDAVLSNQQVVKQMLNHPFASMSVELWFMVSATLVKAAISI